MSLLDTPRCRTLVATAVLAAVPLVVLAGHGSTASGAADTTFTMRSTPESFRLVDVPPASEPDSPPAPGDYFVLKNGLFRSGTRVGALHATCAVTSRGSAPGRLPLLCQGVYKLRGGNLVGAALLTTGGDVNEIAITGGTGRYAGMTGTATELSRPNGTARIQVRLR